MRYLVLACCLALGGCPLGGCATSGTSGYSSRYVDPIHDLSNCHKQAFPQCSGAGN